MEGRFMSTENTVTQILLGALSQSFSSVISLLVVYQFSFITNLVKPKMGWEDP